MCAVIRRDLSPDHRWAGNIRELEQCVRRVLLTRQCAVDPGEAPTAAPSALTEEIAAERLSADQLLARYCAILYERRGSYADVAGITQLDPRTVKKYVMQAG